MMLYPEDKSDPRAKYPGLEWKYTRDQVAQMSSFEAKKAGDLVLKPDHHQEPDAPPEWRYFEILTRIRAELMGKK